jgi:radical SAM protein with 4Fe4S-binding SPASM domain
MMPWRNFKRFFSKALRQPVYALRVAKLRLKANIYYFWSNGRNSYPEAITLFLTHRCNLACQMCGQWGREGVTRKQNTEYIQAELSLDELRSIIDDLSKFKPNITLFGGEPLLHPNCGETIKYIKQKGMHCLMITNGSLLEGLAESIVDAGLDELNVSLDGNAALHDQIRGMPGLFDKIMRGLKQVQYFKTKKKKKRPFLNLQCTITQYNYRDLEQLVDVAELARADSLTFHNLIFIHRQILDKQKAYDDLLGFNSVDWEGFIFEPGIEPQVLYAKIKKILSGKYRFSVDFYPNFSYRALKEYYQNPTYVPCQYASRCLSPWIVAYIFPDGEVRPCLNFSYSYGNIKKNKFGELWNNEKAVNFRKTLKKNRLFPVCSRCTELYRY